jgi:hypothetical protein
MAAACRCCGHKILCVPNERCRCVRVRCQSDGPSRGCVCCITCICSPRGGGRAREQFAAMVTSGPALRLTLQSRIRFDANGAPLRIVATCLGKTIRKELAIPLRGVDRIVRKRFRGTVEALLAELELRPTKRRAVRAGGSR